MNLVKTEEKYVSALHFDWLTRFYDPIMQFTLREKKFKRELIKQANIQSGQRVLDLGCGSGTLTILLKQMHPDAKIVGLDGDAKILEIARRKIAVTDLAIELKAGLSFDMDFPDETFDRVVSSLLFHHLTPANKRRTFVEIHRVLKPGGELHIADWGKPTNILMRAAFFFVQILDGFETTKDNVVGRLPVLFEEAGS